MVEVGVVEGVEKLRAEFRAHPISNGECFKQAQVNILEAWPMNAEGTGIAELSDGRIAVGGWVDVEARASRYVFARIFGGS